MRLLFAVLLCTALALANEAGFKLKLSDAAKQKPAQTATSLPLAEKALRQLLARLPHAEPLPRLSDHRRETSMPPPRTGVTRQTPFPPLDTSRPPIPAVKSTPPPPLEVTYRGPEGKTGHSSQLAFHFSQPMVPVTTHEDLEARTPPVLLTPRPPGKWRWAGPNVLLFEAVPRFPMATKYRLDLPASTCSVLGGELARGRHWAFETAPAGLADHDVSDDGPEPALLLRFDQDVDPQEVEARLRVTSPAGEHPLRRARPEEIPKGWGGLVFKPDRPLPLDTDYQVTVAAGLPSREGPLVTPSPLSFKFSTYRPLRLTRAAGWCVEFNNKLDPDSIQQHVRVVPVLPGLRLQMGYKSIYIEGRPEPDTDYHVIVAAGLQDAHGQRLGHDKLVALRSGAREYQPRPGPYCARVEKDYVQVMQSGRPLRLMYRTLGYPALSVQAYRTSAREYSPHPPGDDPAGELVLDRRVPVKEGLTQIDLTEALPEGPGHLLVRVEPLGRRRPPAERTASWTWVQVTDLGLDNFTTPRKRLGWASSLATGQPLAGVELTWRPSGVTAQTGPDGLAEVDLPPDDPRQAPFLVGLPPGQRTTWGKRADRLVCYGRPGPLPTGRDRSRQGLAAGGGAGSHGGC